MKWYPDLYIGESLQGRDKKIRWLLKHRRFVPQVCLITLAAGDHNQLEIIPAKEVIQPWYPQERLRIIGLAGSKGEALALVSSLLEEAYAATGQADIPAWLRRKWEERS